MSHVEDPAPQSAPSRWTRTGLAKFGAAYLLLAGLGVGVALEFVPSIFDFGELSVARILVLVALLIFVAAPVVAVCYIALNAVVEGLVLGVGWGCRVSLQALARNFKRIFRRPGE